MPNKKKALDKATVIDLYFNQKKSYSEIAKICDCSAQTICNRFKEWGLEARSYSEALTDREISWKDKIAEALKGKTLPDDVKKKISEATQGRIPYNKGLRKATHPEIITYGSSGKNHWNWKGGISSFNRNLRATSEYKHWRDQVFQRDGYICQFCEKKTHYVEAHHIIPLHVLIRLKEIDEELYKELIFLPENGYTLCKECHEKFHKGG